MISIVQRGTIKPTVLMHLAVRCALVAFLCDATLGMARDGAGRADSQAVNPGVVQQARVDPRPIRLPIVDGTDIRFTRLSTADGLSQTKVRQIVQDDQGFIWFGTQYGLNRYDGYDFKLFVHDPRNPNSFSGVSISALFKDRDGALWVGCDQFLNKFDPATETFIRYPIPFVKHISQDSAGILWLATVKGLYSLDPAAGTIRQYSHNSNDPFGLNSNDIRSSGEDKEGRFWVSTTKGLDEFDRTTGRVTLHIPLQEPSREFSFYEDRFGTFWIYDLSRHGLALFDRKTNTLTKYSFDEVGPPTAVLIGLTAMMEDRNGTLWLSTRGAGLLKFDREQRRLIRYRNNPGNPDSIPQNNVENLFEDREGSIWAGLGRMGVTRFATKPLPFNRIPHLASSDGTPDPFVGAIYEDRQGILWIGTAAALNRIDRKAGQYTSYRRTAGPPGGTDVISIGEDRSGNLWVGTYGHGLLRFDRRTGHFQTYVHDPADPYSLSNDIVARVLVDHNGTLWAATKDGLNRFDAVSGRFTAYKVDPRVDYLELVEDERGTLWLGSESSGLSRFDPATGKFTIYEHDINRPGTLSNDRVNSVYFDRSGTMWVGTQNGLDRFDSKTGTFTVYTRRDGMPGNAVGCVLEDDHGNLWMSTNNGVARFDLHSGTARSYSTADGLPGPDLTGWGACFKSPSGEMLFGGFSGATAFYPDSVVDPSYTPPVALTEFRLSGSPVEIGGGSPLNQSISYTTRLTLSHQQPIFSLAFSALSYLNPRTNRYRYKLERLDETWREVGSDERLATYTTLPTGVYTFRVQGATGRSAWSQPGAAVVIEILPPWWSTWWFRGFCVAALLGVLWALYQARIQRVRRQERKLRDVIETIPTFAWTALPDGFVDFVNRHWQEYTGLSTDRTVGSGWREAAHPEDLERNVGKWRASLATGEPFEDEVRYRRAADGQYRWFLSRAVALRDARGKILKWYGTSADIEDRKRAEHEREKLRELEADLAHVNRVSMLGELAASVSHELKQPITAAMTNAKTCLRWLKREQPNVAEAIEATSRIVKDGRRATEIIDRLRSLYKKDPPQRELVEVNEIIREMVELLRAEATQYAISIRTDLVADLPKIIADRVQLQQVFMNLMLNAIEAMKETGGLLTVKTQRGEDSQLLISVNDTGVGLPKEKTEQIFDAFFTTKPQGSGMGLSISRSIVESHGGRLWATPNNGRGATFHFTLATAAEIVPEPGT